jgi:hypothetical protein
MSRSAKVIALAAALVIPMPVSAQSPTPPSAVPPVELGVRAADPRGDLRDEDREVVAGPAFMDLTSFDVRVDEEDLVMTLEVAGDLDEALTTSLWPDYSVMVVGPDTDQFEWIHVRPDEDWAVSRLFGFWDRESVGSARVDGSRMEFRAPRSPFIAPAKLRFFAFLGATQWSVDQDLPDVRRFGERRKDRRAPPPVIPTALPTAAPRLQLAWESLFDSIPDSDTGAAAWLAFDGTVTQNEDLQPIGSPLTTAATTKRVLDQPDRDILSPTLGEIRERVRGFVEAHGEALAAMPAYDGVGTLGDVTALTEALTDWLSSTNPELVDREDATGSRLSAAALGSAVFIYIAERATDPALRDAAIEVADAFHDYALTRIYHRRHGDVGSGSRRAVRTLVRGTLAGFAWEPASEA